MHILFFTYNPILLPFSLIDQLLSPLDGGLAS